MVPGRPAEGSFSSTAAHTAAVACYFCSLPALCPSIQSLVFSCHSCHGATTAAAGAVAVTFSGRLWGPGVAAADAAPLSRTWHIDEHLHVGTEGKCNRTKAKLHILLSAASPVSAWSPCSHLYPPSPSTGSITCIAPPCTLMNGQIGQPANSPHPPTSHLTPVYFHQAENQNPSAFSQLPPLLHFPLPPSDPICLDLPNPSRDSSLSIPSPPPLTPSFPPFSPPPPPPPSSSPLLSPIHSPPPRPPSSPPSFPPHLPLPCPSPLSLSPVPLPRPSPLSLSPVPLPRPSPLSLSPVPLPCPSPPSLSPVPLPCPSPPSLSPVPLPRPSPLSLSPVPLPCPSPPSLSPVPLPPSLSPVPLPRRMERMKVPTKEGLAGRREARNGGKVMRKVTFEAP
ncbi:unnamed protein product [Closterium sp. NIES-64]|nr:unnamed protein product [Closterium sp. NIES-64]